MELIDQLALQWQAAKNKELKARDERVSVEEKILALHPAQEEGSETMLTPAGTKIKTTGKVIYKCDVSKLQFLTADWPADVKPIKMRWEADETRLKHIRANSPVMWAKIASAIETKPGKTGVSIEFAEASHGV